MVKKKSGETNEDEGEIAKNQDAACREEKRAGGYFCGRVM